MEILRCKEILRYLSENRLDTNKLRVHLFSVKDVFGSFLFLIDLFLYLHILQEI